MKKLYLVMVMQTPGIMYGPIEIKPRLPEDIASYLPVYTNKKAAKKDWPNNEIRAIQIIPQTK